MLQQQKRVFILLKRLGIYIGNTSDLLGSLDHYVFIKILIFYMTGHLQSWLFKNVVEY